MNTKRITDDFYISGQVGFSDLPTLAEQGVKSIICARQMTKKAINRVSLTLLVKLRH